MRMRFWKRLKEKKRFKWGDAKKEKQWIFSLLKNRAGSANLEWGFWFVFFVFRGDYCGCRSLFGFLLKRS